MAAMRLLRLFLILSAFAATVSLPAVEPQSDLEDSWFGGKSLSDRLLERESENSLAEDLQEDSEAHAFMHKGWGGRRSSRSHAKYGKYKSKYKNYKMFRMGNGKYKSSYYGSRVGYRRHYYIYGFGGYPYGYHRYGYYRRYRPSQGDSVVAGHLWCNSWKKDADCAGKEIGEEKDLSKSQCIDYCNQKGASCCRIKKDRECNAHQSYGHGQSHEVKAGGDEVCIDAEFRPYSKPAGAQDDLPRPAKNESVVMFVLKGNSEKKLNETYEKIGEYLWSQTQFGAAKKRIMDCSAKRNQKCTRFAECSKDCAHQELRIFRERAPKFTSAPGTVMEEDQLEDEVQTSVGSVTSAPGLPQPANSHETVAWIQTGGTDPDELGAALSSEINAGRIALAENAVQIDSGATSLHASLVVAAASVAAIFTSF